MAMNIISSRIPVACASIVLVLSVSHGVAQEPHRHPAGGHAPKLGAVAFANSGRPAAQESFLRGLALLHSFEYDEAAEGFRDAQQSDPAFAMAFWGEALTYSHLLWGEDDPIAARKALTKLAPTAAERLAVAGTARERAFGRAIEALFVDADLPSRVRGFVEGMRKVAAEYPDDPDASAFTSLALMFVGYEGNLSGDEKASAKSDAITFAERVFRANPEHPGGTHYLIHATDSPATARRGLDAARHYAALAPDAEHALHMPSHIFLQLGMWDDTVASNERAWAASRAEVIARKLSNADLSFHSLHWLQYGYLQQGRYADSRKLIDTAREVLSGVDVGSGQHVDARFAVGWMEFVQAASTGAWVGRVCEPAGRPVTPLVGTSSRERSFRAIALYQRAIVTMMCGRGSDGLEFVRSQAASEKDERTLKTALVHAGLIAYLRGDSAADPDAVSVEAPADQPLVGPPVMLRTNELLGAAHVKAGRARDAIADYERALQTTPNRAEALLGLARARKAAGDPQGAADAYRQLLSNWRQADADVAALQEARGGS
jgi:tetratricopeptide (TPR) repeat protein